MTLPLLAHRLRGKFINKFSVNKVVDIVILRLNGLFFRVLEDVLALGKRV